MAQHDQLYRRAVLYDIALRRDVCPEVDFVLDLYRDFHGGAPSRVLEIGCGPGYHTRELARRGIDAVGLDLSGPMIELAQEQAREEGTSAEWIVGDMRSFALSAPVDLAVCPFDGIDALLSTEDLVLHLRTVRDNLTPGGLYVIDCTHPAKCSYSDYGAYSYSGERDGVQVTIRWATNTPVIDPGSGVAEVGLSIHVDDHGAASVIEDMARERCFTAPELSLLVQLAGGFELCGWYGDYRTNQPLDSTPSSHRMIAVLKKQL